ncbi:MAG: MFS transporter [Beijerinckiaceae bacterium]
MTTETQQEDTPLDRRALRASYGLGLLSLALSDLYVLVVPLLALSLGASATEIGLLMGARSILPALLSIHGGSLMDRLGARRVMIFCTFMVAAMAPVFASVSWFPVLLVVQTFTGLFVTMNWIGAQTLVAHACRGQAGPLGKFNFIARFGTVGAPVLAGLIWDLGGAWPTFFMLMAWALATCLLAYRSPEPNDDIAPISPGKAILSAMPRVSDYTRSFALMLIPIIAFTVVVAGLRNAGTGIQSSIYVIYLEGIGFPATSIGILFGALEVTTGLASLAVGWVRKLGRPEWILLATTAISLSLIAITPFLGGVFALLLLMQLLRGAAQGFMQPLMFSIQSLSVRKDEQGAVVGLRMTANRVFSVVLPPVTGFLVDAFGLTAAFVISGVFLIGVCAFLAILVLRRPELAFDRQVSRSGER